MKPQIATQRLKTSNRHPAFETSDCHADSAAAAASGEARVLLPLHEDGPQRPRAVAAGLSPSLSDGQVLLVIASQLLWQRIGSLIGEAHWTARLMSA